MNKDKVGMNPAEISYKDKKIQAISKWDNDSTGQEVFDWWIK